MNRPLKLPLELPVTLTRLHAVVAAVLVALIVATTGVVLFLKAPQPTVHARLDLNRQDHLSIHSPFEVRFDQPVDLARVAVSTDPPTEINVERRVDRLVVTPASAWTADQAYTVKLGDVPRRKHDGKPLHGWKAVFHTQPKLGVSGYKVDDKPVAAEARATPRSKIAIVFSAAMKSAVINVGGQPAPADRLSWSPDFTTVTVSPGTLIPSQPVKFEVVSGTSLEGDALTQAGSLTVTPAVVMPTNSSSNIGPDFKPAPPFMISIENSGPARPQSGLQQADIVYEYVSEYSITRMEAIYFNRPPDLVGPVRSCRMITVYLAFAYDAESMCSGASAGTLHYLFGAPLVPGTIADFDRGNHFYRVNFKAAPHNLYTDGGRALPLRDQWHLPDPDYRLDPPHPDVEAGSPADPPSIGLHGAAYTYQDGHYLRFDHGTALTDTNTNGQVSVKTVVLLHVPFHDAGWIEDSNGGAHSVWYDMNGSGPAQVYSNGKLVEATWPMGSADKHYSEDHTPVWFSDPQGNALQLNTGLTWIHVLGNGQNS